MLTSPCNGVESINGLGHLWSQTLGDASVCIAILDTPVDQSHPSLVGARLTAISTASGTHQNRGQMDEHGTRVASIIFGQHGGPIKGVAPQCHGVILPVFRAADRDGLSCTQAELADAITAAIRFKDHRRAAAIVINVSGGLRTPYHMAESVLEEVIASADPETVLIVAAAGNDGCDCVHVPAMLPQVLAVGAMSELGEPLDFSNWGFKYRTNGILAPGANIDGACFEGNHCSSVGTTQATGTSYATPIVTGIAALLLSIQLKIGVQVSAQHVRRVLLETATGCQVTSSTDCRKLLAGKLNIPEAFFRIVGDRNMPEIIETSDVTSYASSAPAADRFERDVNLQMAAPAIATDTTLSKLSTSGCSCQTQTKLVYAIGQLTYGFSTRSTYNSMANRAYPSQLHSPLSLFRYLFSLRVGDKPGNAVTNVREANRVTWLLEFGGVPHYALRPNGIDPTSELSDIIFDFMEQEGFSTENRQLLLDEAADAERLKKEERPDYFAIPGVTRGEMVTLDGLRSVPVLYPMYDLKVSWNLDKLIEQAIETKVVEDTDSGKDDFRRMAAALSLLIDPKGDTPETRASNFVATAAVEFASNTKFLQGEVALKGLSQPVRVEGARDEDILYQVVVQYYDVTNVAHATYNVKYIINVTEAIPRLESVTPLAYGAGRFV